MNASIVGAGKMGRVIAQAMEKLGHNLSILDTSSEALSDCQELLQDDSHSYFDSPNSTALLGSDVVISAQPYYANESLAFYCIENSINYCDLGGSVPVSEKINSQAKQSQNNSSVFTDLGLAPGWVNIIAEEGVKEMNGADEVKMMVGGLPTDKGNNPLSYITTWSIDGLLNEYRDDCTVIQNGECKTVKGMDGLETVHSQHLGTLEAFYTSGGASHSIPSMLNKVKDCSYKTLRYPNHCEMVKFLISECEISDDCLRDIFKKGCKQNGTKDLVIVICEVKKGSLGWRREHIVHSDESLSAMQKATAYSISSVADLIAGGHMPKEKVLSYKDVPFDRFNENLASLYENIRCEEGSSGRIFK